ncbi:MAG: amino acid permease [Lachnospiraceae bacterium]|jgi:amino acid transporter/nucleotide-binding universal stress UspA family protein|nr:amino acid permease [Lachnospiraceae bacterium]
MKQKLDRTLGMYSALMISIGTMIGSAIFVLAGTSYATAGPGASLAIFLAGIAAVFTGLSFAELVTVVPKAGGGYVYVKEATGNNIIGFICGWGFWLGYAMSCGLFALGFGNFVHYIFPFIPQMATAYVLVVYVAFTNIRGTKSSGNLQNIITTVLIALLALYVVVGVFHIDMGNQKPYTPFGMSGVFNAMGFLYMTYIGYGLITTASEEVIEPEKTIPKAILISIAAVIVIKTSVFFIGSGILPWNELVPGVTDTPMIDTAMKIGGRFGGYLFAFAGILATLSSINTAVMASSRTSFAMARDNRLPGIFKTVNRRTKTPVVSIVATSVIVVVAVSIRDLEHISTVTSIFSLTGYSLVNVALIIFRKKSPELERKFRVPFFPVTPLLGIGVNLFLIIQLAISDFIALAIALGVIAAGVLYYYLVMPKLKYATKGIATVDIPEIREERNADRENEIIIPVSNPRTAENLLNFGRKIAAAESSTTVVPVKVNVIPDNLLTISDYEAMQRNRDGDEAVIALLKKYEGEPGIKPVLIHSRDIFHAVMSVVHKEKNPLVLMGWHGAGIVKYMYGNFTYRMLQEAPADVGLLRIHDKNAGKPHTGAEFKRILFPYGGGKYSQMTAKVVNRIAKAYDATITLLHVIDHGEDRAETEEYLKGSIERFDQPVEIMVCEGGLVEKVVEFSAQYDLVVMGASLDWGIQEMVTGLRTDRVVDLAECSVLIIKSYDLFLQKKKLRGLLHKTRRAIHQ